MIRKLLKCWRHRNEVRRVISTHLSLLEGDGVADALGGLTDEETAAVEGLARDVPAGGTIVEFGTLFGLTTQRLAECSRADVKVVTVDNFCWNPFGLPPSAHRDFVRRILRPYLTSGKVELFEGSTATFRESGRAGGIDLVFIDADHAYEAVKVEVAWAKAAGVHVIAGHDYGNKLFGVTRAVDEAFAHVDVAGMVWSARAEGGK